MITARTLTTISAVSFALFLTGCGSENRPFTENDVTSPVSPTPTTASSSSTKPTILPDQDLMEKMTCAPLSEELLSANQASFGYPTRTTHVEVGEGLQEGEIWWIVLLDLPKDSDQAGGIRQYLTTAPNASDQEGKWIKLGTSLTKYPWSDVQWPEDKLVVAQSALDKAYECLQD